jgi:hypothetical protein
MPLAMPEAVAAIVRSALNTTVPFYKGFEIQAAFSEALFECEESFSNSADRRGRFRDGNVTGL